MCTCDFLRDINDLDAESDRKESAHVVLSQALYDDYVPSDCFLSSLLFPHSVQHFMIEA